MYNLFAKNIDILPKSNNISWSSDIDTLGTELSFDSLYDLSEGTIVNLYIDGVECFRTITIKKSEGKFSYNYTCLDFSFYLKNEVIKQFNSVSASNAITSLLSEYGIKSRVVNIPTKIKKIYKDEAISSIIDDILEQAETEQGITYFKEMQVNTLVINKLADMKITPTILIGKEITINSSIEELKNKILIVSSGENSNSILATVQDTSSQSKFGLLQQIESVDDKNVAQAKNIASNLLKANNKIFKDTSFDVLGIKYAEAIKANRLIQLKVGKLDGWYRIKSASHNLSNGKHTVNIGLEW
ncbi:MAG TPA: hypothetical protein VIK78_00340 [Ruminiclostridium sp.]